MVLVDTSIWIRHLREGDPDLQALLNEASAACQPFVRGELACGRITNRDEVLSLLKALPAASVVPVEEVLYFIEQNDLSGKGLGLVDVQLLASARLAGLPLWTANGRLKTEALRLGLCWS